MSGDPVSASNVPPDLARWRCVLPDPGVEVDFARSGLTEGDVAARRAALEAALRAMQALEAGAIANPTEQRMVGHYWLRAPARAPDAETADAIAAALTQVEDFARAVHSGAVAPEGGGRFTKLLWIGIGGSALGPQFVADALARDGTMSFTLLDNTDPDGIDRALRALGSLADTLIIVVSKSGGTPETRNGMLETMAACAAQGLRFAARAVAITSPGSALHERAQREGWRVILPMWDWVGGRTSVTSAVGLLPLALLGGDPRAFLAGAAAMDEATREGDVLRNPGALLALFWYVQGNGRGERAMVVLPYKDRLALLSRYLQQLVMESLGKRHDRKGNVVEQGLTVYGNKGSTDQHAYVQQLRDGRHDFFAVFVRVLQDRAGPSPELEDGTYAGDWLDGFLLGTAQALGDAGRRSVTITLDRLDERSLGALIALFERAVGLYAELIDVNAYDQPGVEAGKKAAAQVLALQARVLAALGPEPRTAADLSRELDADPATVWAILQHLAANRPSVRRSGEGDAASATFRLV